MGVEAFEFIGCVSGNFRCGDFVRVRGKGFGVHSTYADHVAV